MRTAKIVEQKMEMESTGAPQGDAPQRARSNSSTTSHDAAYGGVNSGSGGGSHSGSNDGSNSGSSGGHNGGVSGSAAVSSSGASADSGTGNSGSRGSVPPPPPTTSPNGPRSPQQTSHAPPSAPISSPPHGHGRSREGSSGHAQISHTGSGEASPGLDKAEVHKKTLKDLQAYLQGKGVDPDLAQQFEIHIRMTKKKRRAEDGTETVQPRWSVTYVDPQGSILTAKSEVLHAVRQMLNPKKRKSAHVDHEVTRATASADAKCRLNNTDLPADIDGIKVISFGEFEDHPSLVSAVQIYPMGYKAELTYKTVQTVRSGSSVAAPQTLIVEVSSVNDVPAFSVTNVTLGQTHLAFTESALWKKVRGLLF
jgi:hypothetical protein